MDENDEDTWKTVLEDEEVWEVVGGRSQGGIIVRTEQDAASPVENECLATGSLVRELDHDDVSLLYIRLTGAGPVSGWVSIADLSKPSRRGVQKDSASEVEASDDLKESNLWIVVGGGSKGGILVREGSATCSTQLEDRLSTGALIKELEKSGERLLYSLVEGCGPPQGWISIRLKDRELVVPHRGNHQVGPEATKEVAPGEPGSFVCGMDQSVPVSLPRRMELDSKSTNSVPGEDFGSGQAGSTKAQNSSKDGPASAQEEEDFSRLPVRELKKRLQDAGIAIPGGALEKADLVRLLQQSRYSPSPPTATAPTEPVEADMREQTSSQATSAKEETTAFEGPRLDVKEKAAEDLSRLSVRELKKRLLAAGVAIPDSAKEKADLVVLLQRAARLPRKGLAARRRTVDAAPKLKKSELLERFEVVPPPRPAETDALWLSFGYAAGLEQRSTYARFDIRDEMCLRVGGFRHGQVVRHRNTGERLVVVGVKKNGGALQLWFQPKNLGRPGSSTLSNSAHSLKSLYVEDGEDHLQEVSPLDFDMVEDSDGDACMICRRCRLPVGEVAYASEDGHGCLHGECMAEVMLLEAQKNDESRMADDTARTMAHRVKYDIGWVPERMIPSNEALARKLGAYHGGPMCSLMMHGNPPTISIVETQEPQAVIYLEYLITALQVRIYEGRDPMFSLDLSPPYDDMRNAFQAKRFEPDWLRGTSAGEVLFQADYHLKELSMGEYDQPVVGMKSCFDIAQDDGNWDWRAREWFVVKKAEVLLSEENVIMPHVEMGVEAREQIVTEYGTLDDAAVTSSDHPLVRYAEVFTHYFDLIAERLSVIFHLRELTKAQIVAKYILDAGVLLDESWFAALGEPAFTEMRIPQHRREQNSWEIKLQDGWIVDDHETSARMNGVYGGVDLNLDEFDLSQAKSVSKSVLLGEPVDINTMSARDLKHAIRSYGGIVPPGTTEKADLVGILHSILDSLGNFWQCISGEGYSTYSREDQELMRRVFNPNLADRRDDLGRFIPPSMSQEYLHKLRRLVNEEISVQRMRRGKFCSKGFSPSLQSPPFPHCWRPCFRIAPGRAVGDIQLGQESEKVDSSTVDVASILSEKPFLDGIAEDGTRYCIYQQQGLQVRTLQEHGRVERIVAVFRIAAASVQRHDAAEVQGFVVKVKECAQFSTTCTKTAAATEHQDRSFSTWEWPLHHPCVVVETDRGVLFVTALHADGMVSWEVCSEATCAAMRILRCKDCRASRTPVVTLKAYQVREAKRNLGPASPSKRKHYAREAYEVASGQRKL